MFWVWGRCNLSSWRSERLPVVCSQTLLSPIAVSSIAHSTRSLQIFRLLLLPYRQKLRKEFDAARSAHAEHRPEANANDANINANAMARAPIGGQALPRPHEPPIMGTAQPFRKSAAIVLKRHTKNGDLEATTTAEFPLELFLSPSANQYFALSNNFLKPQQPLARV